LYVATLQTKHILFVKTGWDCEHQKYFDVHDKTTKSRMLISTRIAGLLPRRACTELQLSLMSAKEAVEMLGEAQVVVNVTQLIGAHL
jgi:hypothetical protein